MPLVKDNMRMVAVAVVSLLLMSSQRTVSDECEHYYDYYVPQLTHSTRCTGSTGTGCMSLMCGNPGAQREGSCTVSRSGHRCWLICTEPDMDRDDAATFCGNKHARLPVLDSYDAVENFGDVVDQHVNVLGPAPSPWLDGGLKAGVPMTGPNASESTVRDNWTYSNGTVIPHDLWANHEPRGHKETCIRWDQMNWDMNAVYCGLKRQVVCECGNANYPLGALTMSQCIVQQTKGTMAQECWKHATQMVNDAVNNKKWRNTSLDTCQCAWCTKGHGGKTCVNPDRWSTQWWNETTTTMSIVVIPNNTQKHSPFMVTATPHHVVTGKQTVMPLIPTVPNERINFTSIKTVNIKHNKKNMAMVVSMCIIGGVSLPLAVLCMAVFAVSERRRVKAMRLFNESGKPSIE